MCNLAVKPDSEVDSRWQRWKYLPRLLRLLWTLGQRQVILFSLLTVLPGGVTVLSVILLREVVDSALGMTRGQEPFGEVVLWLGLLLAVDFVKSALLWAGPEKLRHSWSGGDIQERLKAGVQERLLAKISRLALATFEHSAFYDRLHRAQRGIDERLFVTIASLFRIPSASVTAIGLLFYVGSAHVIFPATLLLGILPLQILGARILERRYLLERTHTAPRRMLDYLHDLLVDRAATAEIRLFGLEPHLFERRRVLSLQLRDERLELERLNLKRGLAGEAGPHLAYGLIAMGVVALIAQGQMSVGHYVAFLSAAVSFRQALFLIVDSIQTIGVDLHYIRDLFDCLDLEEERPPEVHADIPYILAPDQVPTVRFEEVSFKYPGMEKPVLDGIDMTLAPGERLALVGRNGAGKTTLVKLLSGLYRPSGGRITIDDRDLNDIDPRAWRNLLGAVFQDYVRYQTTVLENIGFGDADRLEDWVAIRTAAAKSGADEVVAGLEAGYATLLGTAYDERGRDLSAGQWQKLALARAYLRQHARVLVLDEPTAALDARAEVDVYRQFLDLAQSRSVLLISHRLGSARLADRILFLEDGHIAEDGAHEELMARNGLYAKLFSIQTEWYR